MTPFGVDFRAIRPVAFNLCQQADADRPSPQQDDAKADIATGKAGVTFLSRVSRRRMAGLKRAAEILKVLPADGETLHAIIFGYFDLMNVVLALLDKVGSP